MLTAHQLCRRLSIDKKRLQEWLDQGLPCELQGRRRMFDPAAVAAWLQQTGKAAPTSAQPAGAIVTTRAEAANLLGVNLRTLATWLTDPTFPGKPGSPGRQDGHFPIAEINAWRALRLGEDARPAGRASEEASAKLRKTLIQCDREQFEFERELRTILDYEATARLIERVIATAQALREQLPDKIDSRLPAKLGPKTRKRIRRAVLEVLAEDAQVLSEMAAGDTDEARDEQDSDDASDNDRRESS